MYACFYEIKRKSLNFRVSCCHSYVDCCTLICSARSWSCTVCSCCCCCASLVSNCYFISCWCAAPRPPHLSCRRCVSRTSTLTDSCGCELITRRISLNLMRATERQATARDHDGRPLSASLPPAACSDAAACGTKTLYWGLRQPTAY